MAPFYSPRNECMGTAIEKTVKLLSEMLTLSHETELSNMSPTLDYFESETFHKCSSDPNPNTISLANFFIMLSKTLLNICNWDCYLWFSYDLTAIQNQSQWMENSMTCACPICSWVYSLNLLLFQRTLKHLGHAETLCIISCEKLSSLARRSAHPDCTDSIFYSSYSGYCKDIFLHFNTTSTILSTVLWYRQIRTSPSWKFWLLLNTCHIVVFWG